MANTGDTAWKGVTPWLRYCGKNNVATSVRTARTACSVCGRPSTNNFAGALDDAIAFDAASIRRPFTPADGRELVQPSSVGFSDRFLVEAAALLYKGAWRTILGNTHPWALQRAANELWGRDRTRIRQFPLPRGITLSPVAETNDRTHPAR